MPFNSEIACYIANCIRIYIYLMLVIILDFLKILYTWSSIACTSFFSTVYFVCKSINNKNINK